MLSKTILFILAWALLQFTDASPILDSPNKKRNIIFMVPDGLPPTGMNLARSFKKVRDNVTDAEARLNIDEYLVGTIKTHSASSLITDSAAAGTAFAVGHKTYNGGIGVDADGNPRGSILEALKLEGYTTGLIGTTLVTDATYAVFAAHVASRKQEPEIAEQFLNGTIGQRTLDLVIGGGKSMFTPQSDENSNRKDDKDLVAKAKEDGWTYIDTKPDWDSLSEDTSLPFMALLAENKLSFEIDRQSDEQPSLAEQAQFALNLLAKETEHKDKGFFIMIEGSRIDHTGHNNDPMAMAHEILAYDDAWKVVTDFVDNTKTDTLVVSIADHTTGGLTLAYDDQPSWYPEVLLNKTHSSEYFANKVTELNSTADNATLTEFIKNWVSTELSITDAEDEEIESVLEAVRADDDITLAISPLTSKRAAIGWTTGGHTNAYTNVHTYTNSKFFESEVKKKEGLLGNHDNTDVPKFFAKLTGVDLDSVTEKLTV